MGAGGSPPRRVGLLLWLLLLRGTAAAPFQGEALSPQSYKDLGDRSNSKEAQRCHNRCPTGFMPQARCPTDPESDCVKQCGPDQFLNSEYSMPQCESCLSCSAGRNLVVKAQCTHNSSGVCECERGLYCATKIPNTCARCLPLTTCKPGFGVRIGGTSDQDTVCEKCPPGTFSEEDSSTETCRPRAVTISPGEVAGGEKESSTTQGHLKPPAAAMRPTGRSGIPVGLASSYMPDMVTGQTMNELNTRELPESEKMEGISKKEEKNFTLLAVALLLTFLLFIVLAALWKKRVCKKWIVPHKMKMSSQATISAIGTLSPAEKGPEETDLMPPESLTEAPSGFLSETEEIPCLDPEGAELVQLDGGVLVEPAVRSHTSNCIEKIYIMRADTVIVGSVSEVPTGKTGPAKAEEVICGGAQETNVAMRYPEQETEFSPESDITTPVEEEWEFPHSTLTNEKALQIQEESAGGTS